ncbi:hypothetical protein [Undibacterium sp. TJN19]|uniref:hypothetical protein n=1 Tax=Undibacterium sp. TJN19 TaxID=3413055 RepID=UPI003BF11378
MENTQSQYRKGFQTVFLSQGCSADIVAFILIRDHAWAISALKFMAKTFIDEIDFINKWKMTNFHIIASLFRKICRDRQNEETKLSALNH